MAVSSFDVSSMAFLPARFSARLIAGSIDLLPRLPAEENSPRGPLNASVRAAAAG